MEKWFYGASMFIYCTHFPFVSTLEKLMFVIFGKNIYVGLLAFATVPVIVIFTLSCIARVINLEVPTVWKILTGNRSMMIRA